MSAALTPLGDSSHEFSLASSLIWESWHLLCSWLLTAILKYLPLCSALSVCVYVSSLNWVPHMKTLVCILNACLNNLQRWSHVKFLDLIVSELPLFPNKEKLIIWDEHMNIYLWESVKRTNWRSLSQFQWALGLISLQVFLIMTINIVVLRPLSSRNPAVVINWDLHRLYPLTFCHRGKGVLRPCSFLRFYRQLIVTREMCSQGHHCPKDWQ